MMLLFCATSMYAQKGKVTQAISYFTSGKLKEAKEMIDVAIKHEACLNWDKAYFTKGQIYQAIYESENKDYKKLDPNALNVAWDAYQKVIELDVKQKYPKKLATQYQNMIFDFTNQAVGYYNAQNFKDALKSFERVLERGAGQRQLLSSRPVHAVGDAVAAQRREHARYLPVDG